MFLRLNDSWPSAAPYGTVLCHHWPPGRLSFLLKPFAFFPRRQKTWWHQDERQAKKRRNGGENCREIKRIDKVGASQKKMGEEIDCDRREREGGRKSDAIDTLKLQREDRKMLFAPSKCYRKTYITMTALWPHQPHKKHTGLFHLPQIVINKNQDKDKRTHTLTERRNRWERAMESQKGVPKEEHHVVRRLARMATWSREQWISHLDLSVWWNKLLDTIPYSTLSTDVTSKASPFPLTSLFSLPSIHLCPYFLSYFPHRVSPPFSLRVSVLSVSDTQWIREYLAARYQTSLHLPLPLCAQAYQSESYCQDRCHRCNCSHWHNSYLPQHSD